jgi:hypothetical protein
MKIHRLLFTALALFTALPASAGESILNTTYLPLLIDPDPHIEVTPVVCLQWSSSSAAHTMDLINVRYVPPSDAPEHSKQDINAASVYGVKFSHSDPGVGDYSLLLMDLSGFSVPGGGDSFKTSIVRACLESLRLCIGTSGGFEKTPVTFKCADADREWVTKLVAEFNAHDRRRPFLTFPQTPLTGINPGRPASAEDQPRWTYRASAGGNGGALENEFYFETSETAPAFPDTGTLASVTRVRAIYALPQAGPIRVVDYSIGIDSIGIKIQHAARKDYVAVASGKSVALVTDDDFRISGQESAGYFTTDKKTLTALQRECADNLILILAMRRSPVR